MAEQIQNFDREGAHRLEAPDISALEAELSKNIVGQPAAVKFWAEVLYRILNNVPRLRGGPMAVVTQIGPSGVGKTEIVKEVSTLLQRIGEERRKQKLGSIYAPKPSAQGNVPLVLRVDCGEYKEKHEYAKLIGSPPGYVGHDATPRLAQSEIDKNAVEYGDGQSVTLVLFDEIEKAHADVNKVLLGGLDYGQIRLGNLSVTDIKRCVVVFTSNLGNTEIAQAEEDGTVLSDAEKADLRMSAMKRHFKKEEISRMGGEVNMVIFEELNKEALVRIVLGKLTKLEKMCRDQGLPVHLQVTESGIEILIKEGYNRAYGVRPLEDIIEQHVSHKLGLIGAPADKATQVNVVIDGSSGSIELFVPQSQAIEAMPAATESGGANAVAAIAHATGSRLAAATKESDTARVVPPAHATASAASRSSKTPASPSKEMLNNTFLQHPENVIPRVYELLNDFKVIAKQFADIAAKYAEQRGSWSVASGYRKSGDNGELTSFIVNAIMEQMTKLPPSSPEYVEMRHNLDTIISILDEMYQFLEYRALRKCDGDIGIMRHYMENTLINHYYFCTRAPKYEFMNFIIKVQGEYGAEVQDPWRPANQ